MAWVFLETVRCRKFQSQIFGTKCRNFWDCFRTVRIEFSGLFSGSLGLGSGLVLIPGPMSSSFVVYFGIIVI